MGTTNVSLSPEAEAPSFWIKDAWLEVWLRLLALHIDDPVTPGGLAERMRNDWLFATKIPHNGCVPHRLDETAAGPEGRAILRGAVESLMAALAREPDDVSAATINLLGIGSGEYGRDIRRSGLLEIGRAFLDLLDDRIVGHHELGPKMVRN